MERYAVTPGYSVGLQRRPSAHGSFGSSPFRQAAGVAGHRGLRRLTEDTELSIFEAERYFKEGDGSPGEEDDGGDRTQRTKGPVHGSPEQSVSPSLSSPRSHRRCRSHYATPTASSEASWNSRSGLLSNPPGSAGVTVRSFPPTEQRKGSSSSACRRLLGRTCLCSGKKAVEVQVMSPSHSNVDSVTATSINGKDPGVEAPPGLDQAAAAMKELEIGPGMEMAKLKVVAGIWTKDEDLFRDSSRFRRITQSGKPFKGGGGGGDSAFSFPVLCNPIPAPGKKTNGTILLNDPSRNSLEVFHPAEELHGRKRAQLQPFSRDLGARTSFTFPQSPSRRPAAMEDDLASDSSSDLFEIESLSTQATPYGAYRRRDSLEEQRNLAGGVPSAALRQRRSMDETAAAPSIAPSECYPPSEVSVEWSVTTAEGGFGPGSVANFSSAASDCGRPRFTPPDHPPPPGVADGGRRRGGGLLSCRSEKAVCVGPDPVKFGAERRIYQFPPDDYEEGIPVVAGGRNGGAAAAAHLARVTGAPPALLAHSKSGRRSLLGR